MKVLIAYGTTDGMTAKIAERLAATARDSGHAVVLLDTARAPRDLDAGRFDAIIVGASLHAQGYQRSVKRFVRRQLEALSTRPTAFFSVCLAIASKNEEERVAARRLTEAFPARVGWRPTRVEVIAGALMFSRYGWLRGMALRSIARKELGEDVDTSRDHIYTDWPAVDAFARQFLGACGELEARKPCASPSVM